MKPYYLSINTIAGYVRLENIRNYFFNYLHSLSRCDYTSSFFHLGKVKFWDTCLVNASILNTFLKCYDCLNLPLGKDDMNVIEKLVISLYNVNSIDNNSVTIAQHELFKYCGSMEICSLPPTQDTLAHHINKST